MSNPSVTPTTASAEQGTDAPQVSNPSEGSAAFAKEIFNLIGHDDVYDITLLQVDMYE